MPRTTAAYYTYVLYTARRENSSTTRRRSKGSGFNNSNKQLCGRPQGPHKARTEVCVPCWRQLTKHHSPAEDPSGRHGRAAAGGRSHSTTACGAPKIRARPRDCVSRWDPGEEGGVRARLATFQESAAKEQRRNEAAEVAASAVRTRHRTKLSLILPEDLTDDPTHTIVGH